MFLQKFVKCFEEDETSYPIIAILRKNNIQDNMEDGSLHFLSKG